MRFDIGYDTHIAYANENIFSQNALPYLYKYIRALDQSADRGEPGAVSSRALRRLGTRDGVH